MIIKRNNNESKESNTLAEERSARLRRLRNLANLSRKKMCELSGIRLDTLIGWEVARHGGLTENGANKVVNCILNLGVKCSIEWLLYGVGETPSVIINYNDILSSPIKKTSPLSDEDKQIIQELIFFKTHHPDTLDFVVMDNSMNPHYQKNDYIAGIKCYKDKLNILIGRDCIIQTMDGKLLFRKILASDESGKYNLTSTNLNTSCPNLILMNVAIAYAAPVIWHRRKNIY